MQLASMISTREIRLAVVTLGGGARPEDSVDHSVGITRMLPCRRGGGAADGQRREAAYGEHPCIPLRVIIEVRVLLASKPRRNGSGHLSDAPCPNDELRRWLCCD
ncbi:hypothetical protein ACFX5Q_31395 [Mesorhizobium sp. IMUNJ 23033]|uniref:hypothetical protein n=1 Tax=Mesorhizobium sp. IMUNJ 23033 TaxID=3378039 RepID=UPI00384B4D2E